MALGCFNPLSQLDYFIPGINGRGSGSGLSLSVPGRAGQPFLTLVTPSTEPGHTQLSHPGVPSLWHWDHWNVPVSPQEHPPRTIPQTHTDFCRLLPGLLWW